MEEKKTKFKKDLLRGIICKESNRKTAGITLIALVITIIVMLILVGVTITVAVNGGLFTYTSKASKETTYHRDDEIIQTTYAYTQMGKYLNEDRSFSDEIRKVFGEEAIVAKNSDGTYLVTLENGDKHIVGKSIENEEIEKEEIAKTDATQPFLPAGAEITNNDLETGLTIKDSNDNEWVWIVVPNDGTGPDYSAVETADDKDLAIETALRTYADTVVTRESGWSDTNHEGTWLTDVQYNKKKSRMLQSIKEHGGFYIGKYEAGYELGTATTARASKDDSIETTVYKPVIQQNAYPYNYITNEQAEELAENLSKGLATTEDGKGSLLFGIQWDLVLKYLNEKSDLKVADLISDSSKWGNYYDAEFIINRGKYAFFESDMKLVTQWNNYTTPLINVVSNDNKKLIHEAEYGKYSGMVLLTTGAANINSKLNIYDLAGNLFEWTLEKTSNSDRPCARRGGGFGNAGSARPVSYRANDSSTSSPCSYGFRPSLY